MKKEDLKVGGIYNVVYQGDNHLYGKINGKRTIEVIALSPKIQYYELYKQYAQNLDDRLRSNTITAGSKSFEEDTIIEVFDKKDYFIKSEITTLAGALSKGLISLNQIESMFYDQSSNFMRRSPVTSVWNAGCYVSFGVEGKDLNNPYLQRIFIKWDSYDQMKKQVRYFFPNAWFM